MLQRLKYELSSYKKLINIEVNFKFFSKSSGKLLTIKDEMKPAKPMLIVKSTLDNWFERQDKVEKLYKEILNKKANKYLKNFQQKEKIQLYNGVIEGGDYIISCRWKISPEFDYLTYEEYKEFMKLKKELLKKELK